MRDDTFEITEICILIQKLVTADSWDDTFSLLKHEQKKLSNPEAEKTLLEMIEQKKQQGVQQAELDGLARYLPLLRDMRTDGLPIAWETFTYTLLDDETRFLVSTAFSELENATTDVETRQIFACNRSLFLSEAAEIFRQHLFAIALQGPGEEERDDTIYALCRLKTFFDLHRLGNEEEAWSLLEEIRQRLEERNQRQVHEVSNALDELVTAKSPEEFYTTLREKQDFLLSSTAHEIVDILLEELEVDSTNPRLHWLKRLRSFLEYAAMVGIQQALDEEDPFTSIYTTHLADLQFSEEVDNWLSTTNISEQRRFLEQHLEIVRIYTLNELQSMRDERTGDKDLVAFFNYHIDLLEEILHQGGSSQDVRKAYVNRLGGLTLDIPPWLEHIEVQLQLLAEQPDRQRERIALYRDAIAHTLSDTDVAPETVASLQHGLGKELKDTQSEDPDYAANLEEALAAQHAAYQTFTFARYPVQHAYVLMELGLCSFYRVEGNRSDNIEYALVCMKAALEVFKHETFPYEWGEIKFHSGKIYQARIAGQKGENLEYALACFRVALEIFQREDYPNEWSEIELNLGLLLVERISGEKRDNYQQAIEHLQHTFEVYTRGDFPYEWATSHLALATFYTEYGFMGELNIDRFALALNHYQQAEQVLTVNTFPKEWGFIQEGIMAVAMNQMDGPQHTYSKLQKVIERGEAALLELPRVSRPLTWAGIQARLSEVYSLAAVYCDPLERPDMLERALEHITIAVQIFMPESNPKEWVNAQRILAEVYLNRIKGNRKENLDHARECCMLALQVTNYEVTAEDLSGVQTSLGAVLLAYPEKRKEDIEQAIVCLETSLKRCHPSNSPVLYARNRICLCQAYVERIEADPQRNIETAIEHGQAVLQICTRQNVPLMWSEAQYYLGIAHVKRTAGERRVNLEQGIQCFEQAAEIFTPQSAPFLWAGTQANLCAAYIERAESGNNFRDANLARQYAEKALQFYTEGNAPREWALLHVRLGIICQLLQDLPGNGDATRQAEQHYLLALRSYTKHNDSLNAALVQLFLGGYYQSLALSEKSVAYKQQALSYYRTALQTFTKESTPLLWAVVQVGLGSNLGLIHFDGKTAVIEREQAVRSLNQAMSIFTRETFPYSHRSILNLNLLIEWKRGNWSQVTQLSQAIYEVERDMIQTSTGTSGLDKVLTQSLKPSPSAYGAFSRLLHRHLDQMAITSVVGWNHDLARSVVLSTVEPEYIEQAAITLERGRAIELARAMALYQAAPEQITNPERRARYTNALQQLNEYRATLAKMASLNSRDYVTLADRQKFLDCTSRCATAQQTFNEILAEIRHAQDPADFLTETVDGAMLQQAVRRVGPGHALVYLVTLDDIGGFALAIQAGRSPEDGALLFEACMLPQLISEVVNELIKDGVGENLSACREKLIPLLFQPLLRWLQERLKPSSMTLIPCGYLTGLPLTGLLIDAEKTLGDWIPTSVAPSALSLLQVESSEGIRAGIFTFGVPQYDPPLPYAEAEAHTLWYIARALGISGKLALQEKATSQALKASLQHALIIDLACHGKVNPDDYLQSYLRLADQPLTLGTILNWQRDMQGLRLLILSACESAAPDVKGAVDEVRSISTAMLQAGARAVLAPLWIVDDRATFLLMTRFAQEWFPQLKTDPPAAALARAQQWLRNVTNEELSSWEASIPSQRKANQAPGEESLRAEMHDAEGYIRKSVDKNTPGIRPYADPIYWAGFQIVGW